MCYIISGHRWSLLATISRLLHNTVPSFWIHLLLFSLYFNFSFICLWLHWLVFKKRKKMKARAISYSLSIWVIMAKNRYKLSMIYSDIFISVFTILWFKVLWYSQLIWHWFPAKIGIKFFSKYTKHYLFHLYSQSKFD